MPTYTLSNDTLSVTLSSLGAELRSVRRGDCEYLWQGTPPFWAGRAPNLFPICGRLFEKRYTFAGHEYTMELHGFARFEEYEAQPDADGLGVRFRLAANDRTRAQYPFEFAFEVAYRLDGETVHCAIRVANAGTGPLPFAYGAHPGFNVPLGGDGAFEDWFLEFAPGANPDAFEFGNGGLVNGRKHALPLVKGNRLPLRHELFNGTGLFLDRSGGEVTLRSETSSRSVTVRYPDMPNVGFWHASGEAPFLCIEPWGGLPSTDGVPDDFATRPNMVRLAPGAETTLRYSVEFR